MAMNVSKKTKKGIDTEVLTNKNPKRNSPPTPPGIGGGMNTSKKIKGIDPDAFTNANPVRNNPPAPKL